MNTTSTEAALRQSFLETFEKQRTNFSEHVSALSSEFQFDPKLDAQGALEPHARWHNLMFQFATTSPVFEAGSEADFTRFAALAFETFESARDMVKTWRECFPDDRVFPEQANEDGLWSLENEDAVLDTIADAEIDLRPLAAAVALLVDHAQGLEEEKRQMGVEIARLRDAKKDLEKDVRRLKQR